jgi:hypothetical protein
MLYSTHVLLNSLPVLNSCFTQLMFYSTHAVLNSCCTGTQLMFYSTHVLLNSCTGTGTHSCFTQLMFYSTHAVLNSCCTQLMLYQYSTHPRVLPGLHDYAGVRCDVLAQDPAGLRVLLHIIRIFMNETEITNNMKSSSFQTKQKANFSLQRNVCGFLRH